MTDATLFQPPPRAASEPVQLPKAEPFGPPVFIADAVSPLAGETVLLLLWKRLEKNHTS